MMADARYSDANPPPAHKIGTVEDYVVRLRSTPPVNPKGAVWRLCTIKQPRSVEELVRAIWPSGSPPPAVGMDVIDGYADWVAAGKPGVHVPQ